MRGVAMRPLTRRSPLFPSKGSEELKAMQATRRRVKQDTNG